MPTKKKSAKALAKKSRKRGASATPAVASDAVERRFYDETELTDVLSDVEQCIFEYEDALRDDEVTSEDTETLISDMNCFRDRLEDFADDGWKDYRDTIEEFSNRLWMLGVAWPQYLPPWHVADIVDPADINEDIRKTWIYEDDFLAIRKMSDDQKMTFKAMVKELVKIGQRKYEKAK